MKSMAFDWEREYWNKRYRDFDPRSSGAGSYGEAMNRKVDALTALPDVQSITEIGCGDFNFGRHLMDRLPSATYLGFDVSDEIIKRNGRWYELPRIHFQHALDVSFVKTDLLLCVDVLFHVIDDSAYQQLLAALYQSQWQYLAVTAYEYDGPSASHVRIRKFDPSVFGTPILREVIEADGEMYFYIFKR